MKNKVISYFRHNAGAEINAKKLAKKLGITAEWQYEEFKAALHSLVQEHFLKKVGKRYKLFLEDAAGEIIGEVQVIRSGAAYVIPQKKKNGDIYIAEHNLNTAMHGDTVEVALFAKQSKDKKLEGEVVRIVKRKWDTIPGVLRFNRGIYFVVPEIPELSAYITIDPAELSDAKVGDRVLAGNIEWVSKDLSPEGSVVQVLMNRNSFDEEYIGIISEYNLSSKFPKAVLAEADTFSAEIPEKEIKKRLDLRNEITFTIDPVDAKDYDDALSIIHLENGNYQVGIHIADVSHYVTTGSELDKESKSRGNSVYLPGKVLPMLPEKLSNTICSLQPNVDRLTCSVIVELTSNGKLESYSIHRSVINSKRRYTYEEVQQIINAKKGEFAKPLLKLHSLAKTLRKKRFKEGSISFATPEVSFVFGEDTIPLEIKRSAEDDSHFLVEEFMLLANQLVAKHLNGRSSHGDTIPFVYRVHDLPDQDKVAEFVSVLKSLGHKMTSNQLRSKDFNAIMDEVKGRPEEILINELAIRSMAKAVYAIDDIGHYGLGFKHYTHFTSPIRRYSDLLVHRIIFHHEKAAKKLLYHKKELKDICEHISQTERNAVSAERAAVKLKQVQYLKRFVGDEFSAIISGVTSFGFFVETVDQLAEGLIRLRDIGSDYYVFDEKKYSITGKRKGRTFRLGDPLTVKLVRADETRCELDFTIVEEVK